MPGTKLRSRARLGLMLGAALLSACDRSGQTEQAAAPPLRGLADYHNHQFAYLGFGGTAINHSIDPAAPCLPPPAFGGTFSVRDLVRRILFGPASEQFQRGQCNPTVWSMASQRVDTDNLKRAWQYGLRLIVMQAVSSEFLCEAAELAENCPSDRRAIEQQIEAAKALQKALDDEAGGDGLGWYRIVTTPAEARRVIGEGKLAVVLGIEAANPYGCRIEEYARVPSVRQVPSDMGTEAAYRNNCTLGYLTQEQFSGHARPEERVEQFGKQSTHMALALFEHYWRLGVRHFYLTHNLDGLAGGTAVSEKLLHADTNPSGAHPGLPWANRRDEVDRVIKAVRPPVTSADCASLFPFDGGRCNAAGLSEEGRALALAMAANGTVIDADHLSYRARRQLMNADGVLKGFYPLVSSHSGMSALNAGNANNEGQMRDEDIIAIIRAGGAFAPRLPPVTAASDQQTFPAGATVAPHDCGGTSESFVQAYRYLLDKFASYRPNTTRPFVAGVGIGTDFGPPIPVFAWPRFAPRAGLVVGEVDLEGSLAAMMLTAPGASSGRCHREGERPMVRYPFTSPFTNMSFDKAATPWDGRNPQHQYDISFDGIPHIGMIPDFIEELRVLGLTAEEMEPLWHGAEAYIRTWEAAEAWRPEFDAESKAGVRETCEAERTRYLAAMDIGHVANAVTALRALLASRCTGAPGQA